VHADCLARQVLALVPIFTLKGMPDWHPHRVAIFSLELIINGLCLALGAYVTCCEAVAHEPDVEKQSLVDKAKQKGKAIVNLRPPKTWL
jgi:hypothetical protein